MFSKAGFFPQFFSFLLYAIFFIASVQLSAETFLDSSKVTPSTINVSIENSVTVDVWLRNTPDSLYYVFVYVGDPAGEPVATGIAQRVQGTGYNGKWTSEIYIYPSTLIGTYPVYVQTYDISFDVATFNTGKTLQVTGGDSEPPTLAGEVIISSTALDVSSAPQYDTVTVPLQDNFSGVAYVTVIFRNAQNQNVASGYGSLISGDNMNGVWKSVVEIPQKADGQLQVIVDAADNAWNSAELVTGKFLTVTGGDTELPVFVPPPVISPSSVNVSAGNQNVTVTVTLQDDKTKVDNVYFNFNNEETNAGGNSAELVSGDSLNGQWSAELTIPQETEEGTYFLEISAYDRAGNYLDTITTYTLQVSRVPEALVTFRVDMRRLSRLGLFNDSNGSAFIEIFNGVNAGTYYLEDPDKDSIWTYEKIMVPGQTINYAYAFRNSSQDIYELNGSTGGRSLNIPSAVPMLLPVVTFDNVSVEPVDQNYAARVVEDFYSGNPYPVEFNSSDIFTYTTIDLSSINNDVIASVRRFAKAPGGSLPSGIATMSTNIFWAVDKAPAAVSFEGKIIFEYNLSGGITDPASLRLLKRESRTQPWTIVATELSFDSKTLSANVINSFSEWTIGSVSAANTLQPEMPGLVSNPYPSNGEVNVERNREFTWNAAPAARSYDYYIWKAGTPEPSVPTRKDLLDNRVQNFSSLDENTNYNWKVVAKNIVGSTAGPVWSFSTQSVSDLIVNSLQIPPSAFSGKQIDIQWVVKNNGNFITTPAHWTDVVYLSTDSLLDTRADTYLGNFESMNPLNPGESYVNNITAVLPQGIFGDYYIIVGADLYNFVPEISDSNNITAKKFNVELTPPPDLQVISLQLPEAAFSGTDITLSYTVQNTGANAVQTAIWYDAIYFSADSVFNKQQAERLIVLRHDGVLSPDSIYSRTINVTLPDAVFGRHFIYVIADYDNKVFEYTLESNNIRQSAIQVTLSPPPDLVITSVSGPPSGNSGTKSNVSWTVRNQGPGKASGNWRDRIFVSKVTPFDSTQALFVKEVIKYHALDPDSSYNQTTEVILPNGASGSYYIFVETDWKNQLFEYTFEDNNITSSLSAIQITLSPWADLVVTSLQKPDSASAADEITVSFTVSNQGEGAVSTGQWTDSIYISSSSSWDPMNIFGIGSGFSQTALSPGSSYEKILPAKIPRYIDPGTYYIYVITDAGNAVYEHTGEENNIVRSGIININQYPPVDLAVTSLTSSATGSSGQPFNIDFTVKNQGTGTTPTYFWMDNVYLSADTLLDTYEDIYVTGIPRLQTLAGGASYSRSITTNLPNGISGDYYVMVKCDSTDNVMDVNLSNNVKYSASRISVTLSPSPELELLSASVPSEGHGGQPLNVSWNVKNNSFNISSDQLWNDGVYLSQNSVLDYPDILLGTTDKKGPLNTNASYAGNLEVMLPVAYSGNYYIIVKTDSRNSIYEHNAESNNTLAFPISITLPPPSDLVVTDIIIPATAVSGRDVSVTWTINNQGINPAQGRMSEAVYFSADTSWEIEDPLLGIITRDINLNPGASISATFKLNTVYTALADSAGNITADLPGLLTGDYHIIVKTNFRHNIRESDYTNNRKASPGKVNVDVVVLPVSVTVTDTIKSQGQNFYRINVPDGTDLRITATGSSNIPTLDIYTAYGRIPSTSDYDYRTMDPVPPQRELFIPSTQAGNYFITVRSTSNLSSDIYSIIGEVLSFSVISISPAKGGMGGQVTTSLSGAGFRDSTKVFLYKSGSLVTTGKVLKVNNTMDLVVRWDLKNVPLGTYDVVALNKDGASVSKTDGFQVEPAREMVVSMGLSTPNRLLYGRKETYNFRFTNTSNVDVPYVMIQLEIPTGSEASLFVSPRFITRSNLIPDSLKLEPGSFDNYYDNGNAMLLPMLVRDLTPGEALDCKITFRNLSYAAGGSFPMSAAVRTMDRNAFLNLQMSTIESSRQSILASPSSFPPEISAGAYNAESFAQSMLEGYITIGLIDQEDVPSSSLMAEMLAKTNADDMSSSSTWQGGITPVGTDDFKADCEAFFSKLGCIAAIADCFIPVPPVPPPFNFILCGFGIGASCGPWDAGLAGCIGLTSALTCIGKELICKDIVASLDPNDIIGPEGYGDKKWVAVSQTLPYQIRFENDPKKATAPAQRISITQQLDSTVDARSFKLGSFGFANQSFDIPGNPSFYSTRLDLRDSLGIYVDILAGIDITTRKATWSFKSVDPSTGELPFNPLTGLLPINDSTGRGNGFVRYTVRPEPTSVTGDIINAKAKIIFDQNDPLDTPPVYNTIDAVPPVSRVKSLASTTPNVTFPVNWGGKDDSTGSELKSYSVYVSVNDSQFTAWKINTTDTTAIYEGVLNNWYRFISLATDNAGNIEPTKLRDDAVIHITTSVEEEDLIPKEFVLEQNYPNPFNPSTIIKFGIPEKCNVQIKIFDILGSEVTTLVNGEMEAGWYQREFKAFKYASGIYIYRIKAGTYERARKMVLLK